MNYKKVIRVLEEDGWFQVRQKGSHRAYKHNSKPGIVTIANHRIKDEVPPGPKQYF